MQKHRGNHKEGDQQLHLLRNSDLSMLIQLFLNSFNGKQRNSLQRLVGPKHQVTKLELYSCSGTNRFYTQDFFYFFFKDLEYALHEELERLPHKTNRGGNSCFHCSSTLQPGMIRRDVFSCDICILSNSV